MNLLNINAYLLSKPSVIQFDIYIYMKIFYKVKNHLK